MGLSVSAKVLIKFLEENGYVFIRANGTSHHIYGKNGNNVPVPVHPGEDLPKGTLKRVLNLAFLEREDFLEWLGRK